MTEAPRRMTPRQDPYRALGLVPGASAGEIRSAYRRLAKLNHPDTAGERSLPRFLAIKAAYEELVPGFEALFVREGRDWNRFYDAVKRLAALPRGERHRLLKEPS